MAATKLVESFEAWAEGRPGLEPDVVDTIVDLKAAYLDDDQPGHWRSGDLSEVLLELIPRKVSADDEWLEAVVPTTRAFITYAAGKGLLGRGSAPVQHLLRELQEIAAEFDDAVRDTSRFGMSKAIFSRMGVDPARFVADPAELEGVMNRFNALPLSERVAITDPALVRAELASSGADRDVDSGELGAAGPLPAVRLQPVGDLAVAARACILMADLDRFATWLGQGRGVTATGVLTLKEARSALHTLGWESVQADPLDDVLLPAFGGAPGGGDERRDRPVDDSGQEVPPVHPVRSARDLPRLHRLWTLAEAARIIEVQRTKAYPGPGRQLLRALHESGAAADERLLTLWREAFAAALETTNPDEDRFAFFRMGDVLGDAVIHAVLSAYTGDPHTIDQLTEELIRPSVPPALAVVADVVVGSAAERLREALGRLVDLGAVRPFRAEDDEPVELSPLGVYGMREFAVSEGVEAPIVGDVVTLPAAEAVEQIVGAADPLSSVLAREWFAGRDASVAVDEMLAIASTASAMTRYTVLSIMQDALQDGFQAAVASVAGDPLLGPVIRAFLAERDAVARELESLRPVGGPDDATFGEFMEQMDAVPGALEGLRGALGGLGWRSGGLPPEEHDLMLVESLARAIDGLEMPIRTGDLEDDYWQIIDDVAVLRLAAVPHPDRVAVLDALGTAHPRGRVRKAAKKAAHKLRLGSLG